MNWIRIANLKLAAVFSLDDDVPGTKRDDILIVVELFETCVRVRFYRAQILTR